MSSPLVVVKAQIQAKWCASGLRKLMLSRFMIKKHKLSQNYHIKVDIEEWRGWKYGFHEMVVKERRNSM